MLVGLLVVVILLLSSDLETCRLHQPLTSVITHEVRVDRELVERGGIPSIVSSEGTKRANLAVGTRARWAHPVFRAVNPSAPIYFAALRGHPPPVSKEGEQATHISPCRSNLSCLQPHGSRRDVLYR